MTSDHLTLQQKEGAEEGDESLLCAHAQTMSTDGAPASSAAAPISPLSPRFRQMDPWQVERRIQSLASDARVFRNRRKIEAR